MPEGTKHDLEPLWKLAQNGDQTARDGIAQKIIFFAYQFTARQHSEREDIVQEVAASVFRSLPLIPCPRNFRSFLRYRTLSVIRKCKPGLLVYLPEGAQPLDPLPPASEQLITAENAALLRKYVVEMEAPFRKCLYLRYWGGFSISEIAEHEGVSRTAVYLRLRTSVQRLELKLRQKGL